ncbi:hypothetical protein L6452_41870 [Arctium lappa]|uniref:Uncharacterized protein n=1 Tax=Arctium lappa TaxID=4217 RepID=A0ACB8XH91_ARCLA|nr:hypothetical protein L6452_41870 [Arctium lappa]
MDKFLINRKATGDSSSTPNNNNIDSCKQSRIEINLSDLTTDPGLRIRILDYNPNIRDEVGRAYLLKGPCQPRSHDFPYTAFGKRSRRFNPAWFDEFCTWLEYSISKNAAYCLCCYLFKPSFGDQGGGESFVGLGFTNWAKKENLTIHIGGVNSDHNQAWGKCEALLNRKQHIESIIIKHSNQARMDYKLRLIASIDCIRFLLRQGLAFRDHDEREDSDNRGNFIELLQFLADHNESIKEVTLNNAP